MEDRVLLLSAPFGYGHLQAARAIAEACREMAPASVVEVVEVESSGVQVVSKGYQALLRYAPFAYRSLYEAPVGAWMTGAIRAVFGPEVRRAIGRVQPTAIVATHPFPGGAASFLHRHGAVQAPVVTVVTDFLPHPVWINPGTHRYFVSSPDAEAKLRAWGVPDGRIQVTGIPLRSAFTRQTAPVRSDGRRVLIMGGGLGLGRVAETVRSLARLPKSDLSVTVVCGRNAALQNDLQRLYGVDRRFSILGYATNVPELLRQTDLFVTKPGGISCAEALACGVPIALIDPLPGQEEENAAHLLRTGATIRAKPDSVGEAVGQLLYQSPERLVVMRESARLTGRPQAARAIATEVLELSAAMRRSAAASLSVLSPRFF